jgi:hypothetical protein
MILHDQVVAAEDPFFSTRLGKYLFARKQALLESVIAREGRPFRAFDTRNDLSVFDPRMNDDPTATRFILQP